MNTISLDELEGVLEELYGYIQSIIKGEVIKTCEEALRKYVQSNLYGAGGSPYYVRTGEVLEAVDVTNVNVGRESASFDIVIDTGLISAFQGPYGMFNHHMGFRGQDFSNDNLIQVLEYGSSGGKAPRAGAGFFADTFSELSQTLVPLMVGALQARGWDAYAM